MNDDARVTIIVPAYNIEKYIEKCAETILNQTYDNIELIIVDDGSTDTTPSILDRIAEKDKRVIIIHKENGGVSAARNTALDIASGEYIIFVDGDDYLSEDYVEYMLYIVKHTGADFCLSKNCYTRNNESQVEEDKIESLSSTDATSLLLSPQVIVGCWNKIYRKSLLSDIGMRFSTNLFYGEGLSFITTAAQHCDIIGVGCRKVYYYRRNNELSATTKFNIEKMHNGEKALNQIGASLQRTNEKVNDMLVLHKSLFALGALTRIHANDLKKEYKADYKHWLELMRSNLGKVLFSKYISLYRKTMILGGCISPWLMMKLDKIRRKQITENSVE